MINTSIRVIGNMLTLKRSEFSCKTTKIRQKSTFQISREIKRRKYRKLTLMFSRKCLRCNTQPWLPNKSAYQIMGARRAWVVNLELITKRCKVGFQTPTSNHSYSYRVHSSLPNKYSIIMLLIVTTVWSQSLEQNRDRSTGQPSWCCHQVLQTQRQQIWTQIFPWCITTPSNLYQIISHLLRIYELQSTGTKLSSWGRRVKFTPNSRIESEKRSTQGSSRISHLLRIKVMWGQRTLGPTTQSSWVLRRIE